jgi:hypothetical protein
VAGVVAHTLVSLPELVVLVVVAHTLKQVERVQLIKDMQEVMVHLHLIMAVLVVVVHPLLVLLQQLRLVLTEVLVSHHL